MVIKHEVRIKQEDLEIGATVITDFWDYTDTAYVYEGLQTIPDRFKGLTESEGQFFNKDAKDQFAIDGKFYLGSVKFANLKGDFVKVDDSIYVYEGLNVNQLAALEEKR